MLAHANRAYFVDDHAAIGDPVRIRAVGQFLGHVDSARRLDDFTVGFLHIFRHLDFVVAPLPVETQHGDAPLVDSGRIDFAVAIFVGNHFTATGESNERAVLLLALLLQRRAVAFELVAQVIEVADARHVASAAKLDVIAAQELVLAIELPPRQVHMHAANAVVIVRRHFFELRGSIRHHRCRRYPSDCGQPLRRNSPGHRGITSDFEFSSSRADSQALAATMNARALTRFSSRVALSM